MKLSICQYPLSKNFLIIEISEPYRLGLYGQFVVAALSKSMEKIEL